MNIGPMLNAYPDSFGGDLSCVIRFLKTEEVKGSFASFYILPSLFHSDLDRGFSVIDYDLESTLASEDDLEEIRKLGMDLKLDFVLNHLSVNSPQFQDLMKNGEDSPYKDFFIDWNRFWEGKGQMNEEGCILPEEKYLHQMFFRKPGLPVLMVPFPDGTKRPYWNTFYQEVTKEEETYRYKGQMDLNINDPRVRKYYADTLRKLSAYGAKICRLDAFAYAPKEAGKRNFLNDPETWELLDDIAKEAAPYGMTLLPEIHASYEEKIYEKIAEKGYPVYDFFLPGLMIEALMNRNGETISLWANEILTKKLSVINMLGCHDGIPVLDLKGMIPEERIEKIIDTIIHRGGLIKNLHGQKNVYYQVNASYYSALGEEDISMILARAIQLFMPGKPQIWYLDLLKGKNDLEAVKRSGSAGHKEINRTNLSEKEVKERLKDPAVIDQLTLIRFRNEFGAFTEDAKIEIASEGHTLKMIWKKDELKASMACDLKEKALQITAHHKERCIFNFTRDASSYDPKG